ncbi:MAG: cobalt ECF transporter T component CbiQ [Oscillospiraceae bacterium]|jgi:cobalt/nickel transport system permease protein|nr:cobalt ECF transporter T component CbiQ [Oscillospiraceae bacterium]
MHKAIRELHQLENLAAKGTVIHRLPPAVKLVCTLVYVIAVAALGRYSFYVLTPFVLYPCILMALAELPYALLLKRLAIALPFALFGAVSSLIFDPHGVLAALTILLKTYLCVMAALILVATTCFTEISRTLRRMRVPKIFVVTLELTYRYIGVLLEEAHSMRTAYLLRSGTKTRNLEMMHMGSFLGQLVLRSFDRAERIYAAMKCRGY